MRIYDFTLILTGEDVMTEDMAEAIVAAGCDDGSPGSSQGRAFVTMHREADCLEAAIRSAIADVGRAGYTVSHAIVEADAAAIQSA